MFFPHTYVSNVCFFFFLLSGRGSEDREINGGTYIVIGFWEPIWYYSCYSLTTAGNQIILYLIKWKKKIGYNMFVTCSVLLIYHYVIGSWNTSNITTPFHDKHYKRELTEHGNSPNILIGWAELTRYHNQNMSHNVSNSNVS